MKSSVKDMHLLQVQLQTESAEVLPLSVSKQLGIGHTCSTVINMSLGHYGKTVLFLTRKLRKAGGHSGKLSNLKLRVYCPCSDRN